MHASDDGRRAAGLLALLVQSATFRATCGHAQWMSRLGSEVRPAVAFGAALIIAVLSVSPFADATVQKSQYFEGSRVSVDPTLDPEGGGISVYGGKLDHSVVIQTDDATDEFVITDEAGAKVDKRPGPGQYAANCNQISYTTVRCALFEPGIVYVGLGPGDDSFLVDTSHVGAIFVDSWTGNDFIEIANRASADGAEINSGPGSDVILGGPATDVALGGLGDDLVRGRGGDDYLYGDAVGVPDGDDGGPVADRVSGGPGNDKLRVADADEDRWIGCGPGDDYAAIDKKVDPKPVECENVSLR